MDPYRPDQWHDFFLATAGAAAALAGLLFVALSLHMRYIATETVYREMARGSLIGLVMALVLSLLVLAHQPVRWLGIGAALAGAAYLGIVAGQQVFSLRRSGRPLPGESLVRSIVGYFLAFVGLVTGLGIAFEIGPGLYVIALIVVAIVMWSLWNAWVLVIGVADEEIDAEKRAPRV